MLLYWKLCASVPTADFGQDEWLGERLYQESNGLPVLMVEYLSALATGVQLTRGDPWPLPSSVHDLFRARLAGVSETGRQLLTTAAIIGLFRLPYPARGQWPQ